MSAVRSSTDPLCYSRYCWYRSKPSLFDCTCSGETSTLGTRFAVPSWVVPWLKRLLSEGFDDGVRVCVEGGYLLVVVLVVNGGDSK